MKKTSITLRKHFGNYKSSPEAKAILNLTSKGKLPVIFNELAERQVLRILRQKY
jgi:hypothetical protein